MISRWSAIVVTVLCCLLAVALFVFPVSVLAQSTVTWYATIMTYPGETRIRVYDTLQACMKTWREYEPQLHSLPPGTSAIFWVCKPLRSDEAVLYEGPKGK